MTLLMTKKATPAIALIVVPAVTGILSSFFLKNDQGVVNVTANLMGLGRMVTTGLNSVAATGVLFIFAILFFGVLNDAGTFRPIIKGILSRVGADPVKIAVGSAILGIILHLDGAGASTFLIAIPALMPIYKAVGMRFTTMTCIVGLAAGTMNFVPWSAVPIRAATTINMNVNDLWTPLIIPQICGLITITLFAFFMGRAEKKRLALEGGGTIDGNIVFKEDELTEEQKKLLRPHLFPINVILIFVMIFVLIFGTNFGVSAAVAFMLLFVIAMVINYRTPKIQRERVDGNAKAAVLMASTIFAAGFFTGIMRGTGMLTEMSVAFVNLVPHSVGRMLPIIVGVISMPASLVFDPDSFYFGVLPTLANTAEAFGVPGYNVARAALLGQMTTGFPTSPLTPSTFLLVGLAGVELGEHQKRMIPYAFATTIIMLIVSLLTGAIRV
jgi:CitMHS family citrate-Mg2+:H+ or citrate-Ca2+:H+ symporter